MDFSIESRIKVKSNLAGWHWGSSDGWSSSLPFSQSHKATLCCQHSRTIASSGKSFCSLFCTLCSPFLHRNWKQIFEVECKKVTSNIYCINWLIPRFDFFQEALNKAQKFSCRAIFMYWVYIICVLVCVLAAVAEFASVMNSAFTIRWLYLWNLSSFLYSLNSVWQSAEEMLRTFWMLVKNWAFRRYSNCLND